MALGPYGKLLPPWGAPPSIFDFGGSFINKTALGRPQGPKGGPQGPRGAHKGPGPTRAHCARAQFGTTKLVGKRPSNNVLQFTGNHSPPTAARSPVHAPASPPGQAPGWLPAGPASRPSGRLAGRPPARISPARRLPPLSVQYGKIPPTLYMTNECQIRRAQGVSDPQLSAFIRSFSSLLASAKSLEKLRPPVR